MNRSYVLFGYYMLLVMFFGVFSDASSTSLCNYCSIHVNFFYVTAMRVRLGISS